MNFKINVLRHRLRLALTPRATSREALVKYQHQQLAAFAAKTLGRSPFYSRFFEGKHFRWDAVPVISKEEFMAHFTDINTVGIEKDQAMALALAAETSRDFSPELNGVTVGLSTGTSGKRSLFLASTDERAKWVATVLQRVLKPQFRRQKAAFLLRSNSNLYASVRSALFEFEYFDIFRPMSELIEELAQYQPHILAAQPSVLLDICEAQRRGNMNLSPVQIISFAEVLHPTDRRFIEDTFGVRITEVYQCTEGFLGVSCPEGTMHLNEDLVQIEPDWIDQNTFYPIITDFSRTSQPVVKYRLNDILRIKQTACPCGSVHRAIDQIVGRDDDVLVFGDKKLYPDLLARRLAVATNDFIRYSVEQIAARHLKISIVCEADAFSATCARFREVITKLLGEMGAEDVTISCQNDVRYVPGEKHRKIRNLLHAR